MPAFNLRFGGGIADTNLHPLVAVAMLILIILMLLLPRKYVIIPFLFGGILIPLSQQVVIGGIHFMVLRFLILAGCFRMAATKLSSSEPVLALGFTSLDKAFVLWGLFRSAAAVLLFFQVPAFVNTAGFIWDAFGGYFVLRFLIRDEDDIYRTLKATAWIAGIVAVCMLNEQLHDQNVFGFLGGMPIVPQFREGRIRAQGPFAIPILAGTFGATLLPLFVMLWKSKKARVMAIFGAISSTIIAIASFSSTSILGWAGGFIAVCFWPLRKKMRVVRWALVIGLVSLNMIMKAPVWFIITHFELVGGSSNYHRAELIDMFVKHFWDWWLIGTNNNTSWGWDMWDLANQFVAEGEVGGLATLVCFIAIITICFKWIGKARKAAEGDPTREWVLWLLGAALFSNIVSFFGISYFDQTRFYWFTLLAIMPVATLPILASTQTADEELEPKSSVMKPRFEYPPITVPGAVRSRLRY